MEWNWNGNPLRNVVGPAELSLLISASLHRPNLIWCACNTMLVKIACFVQVAKEVDLASHLVGKKAVSCTTDH